VETKQFGSVTLERSGSTGLWAYVMGDGECYCEVDCGLRDLDAIPPERLADVISAYEYAVQENERKEG
jgi:hypothetical protein